MATETDLVKQFARTVNANVLAAVMRVSPPPSGIAATEWCAWCATPVKRSGTGRPNVAGHSHGESAGHHYNLIRWHAALERRCEENRHYIDAVAERCQCGEFPRRAADSSEPADMFGDSAVIREACIALQRDGRWSTKAAWDDLVAEHETTRDAEPRRSELKYRAAQLVRSIDQWFA